MSIFVIRHIVSLWEAEFLILENTKMIRSFRILDLKNKF